MSAHHRIKEPPAFLAATVTAFLAVGLTGCSTSEEYVYCIDDDGEVVDPELCEDEENDYDYDGGGSYWYYVSSKRYSLGSYVPGDHRSSRIDPKDSSARTRAGFSGSGKAGGTTIRSGGFGSGSGGSGGGGFRGGGS